MNTHIVRFTSGGSADVKISSDSELKAILKALNGEAEFLTIAQVQFFEGEIVSEEPIIVAKKHIHAINRIALPKAQHEGEVITELTTPPESIPISIWRFQDAPQKYRVLSGHGGDEDWVIFQSQNCSIDEYAIDTLVDRLTGCDNSRHEIDGGILWITSH